MPLGRSAKNSVAQPQSGVSEPSTTSPIDVPSDSSRSSFALNFGRYSHSASSRSDRGDSLSSSARSRDGPVSSNMSRTNSRSGYRHSRPHILFDLVRQDDIRTAHAIEISCLLREDVSSMQQLTVRLERAPNLFIGAYVSIPPPFVAGPLSVTSIEHRRRLVGFISATAAPANITQSMYGHSNSSMARVVCIQNLCVDPNMRRQGIGRHLMETLIQRLQTTERGDKSTGQEYEMLSVVCPEKRISFFDQFDFKFRGASYISHGIDPWFELYRNIFPDASRKTSFTADAIAELKRSTSSFALPPAQHAAHSLPSTVEHEISNTSSYPHHGSGQGSWALSPLSTSPNAQPFISDDQMFAKLLEQNSLSEGAARDLGLPAPAQTKRKDTGKALEQIFGEAIASKLPSEDARTAIQARIVDRNTNKNICRLLCPDDNCGCVIIGRQSADWQVREIGPLADAVTASRFDSDEPNRNLNSAPWLRTLFQAVPSGATIGPVRGFWRLPDPMAFDNATFSRSVPWHVPQRQTSQSGLWAPPGVSTSDTAKEEVTSRHRRSERDTRSSLRSAVRPMEPQDSWSSEQMRDSWLDVVPGEDRIIKFIMCPDCGCGPLGFMILPLDQDTDSQDKSSHPVQECFTAAYSVHYDM